MQDNSFNEQMNSMATGGDLGGGDITAIVLVAVYIGIFVVTVIGLWKMFEKGGIPGILGIIPIVNLFFICKLAGKPMWWAFGFLVPVLNIIVGVIVWLSIAERFGRGIGTVLGLIFLTPIFVCILGFGSAQWSGPPAGTMSPSTPPSPA